MTEPDDSDGKIEEVVVQPSEVQGIDELFALYTRKVHELEVLNKSIASTERLRRLMGGIVDDLQSRAANDNLAAAQVEVRRLERTVVQKLARQPDDLYRLEPRQFEELVCALLADMGLDAKLTPATKDGGRDILALHRTPIGEFLTIVECKRYRADRPVRIQEIRSFLFTVREKDKACGMLATTSYFSKESANLAADYAYQLKLKDVQDIRDWLGKYGTWTQSVNNGFWLPTAGHRPPFRA